MFARRVKTLTILFAVPAADEYYPELSEPENSDIEENLNAFVRAGKVFELENYFNEDISAYGLVSGGKGRI